MADFSLQPGANLREPLQGNKHPPVHVHVIHPDGKAIVYLGGTSINSSVPAAALNEAAAWVVVNNAIVLAE
jgi:hypothetical protein